jgi:hypothetical protein
MGLALMLITLWGVPAVTFLWARRRAPRQLWRLTGVSLGLVVAPASSGLYGLYFIGPLAAVLGLVGLPLAMFHGGPGFELATLLGLREPRTVVRGVEHIHIALLNAGVWSLVYGAVGWAVDAVVGMRRTRSDAA